MKVRVIVLECKAGHAVSAWGRDSGGVSLTQGEVAILEGDAISLSGNDGIGRNVTATADKPPPE